MSTSLGSNTYNRQNWEDAVSRGALLCREREAGAATRPSRGWESGPAAHTAAWALAGFGVSGIWGGPGWARRVAVGVL